MPFSPLTPIGPVETLLDRAAEGVEAAAEITCTVSTDTGIASSVTLAGDAVAGTREAFGALRDHQLADTTDPRITTWLLGFWARVGL